MSYAIIHLSFSMIKIYVSNGFEKLAAKSYVDNIYTKIFYDCKIKYQKFDVISHSSFFVESDDASNEQCAVVYCDVKSLADQLKNFRK